jgi:ubiquinone/menaquinone biosynthesis C-methylase UbiE
MRQDLGRVWDYTTGYRKDGAELRLFLDHYLPGGELAGRDVLDAGCRLGDYTRALLEKGARSAVGVDLSPRCIEVARRRFHGVPGLDFVQADLSALTMFGDSSFDTVLCLGTIMYLAPQDAQRAWREFVRITRPGGTIVVVFLRSQGLLGRAGTRLANSLPLPLFHLLLRGVAPLLWPLACLRIGRKVSLQYLKYDVLWSLIGVRYGVPLAIPDEFLVASVTPKTALSYRVRVPPTKEGLDFPLRDSRP